MCMKRCLNSAYANYFTCFDNEDLFRLGISNLCLIEKKYITPDYQAVTGRMYIAFQVNPRILLGHTENKYICIVPCSEIGQVLPALYTALKAFGFEDAVLMAAEIKKLDLFAEVARPSVKPPVGIKVRPVLHADLLNDRFINAALPQHLFLGFFPDTPFPVLTSVVVCHVPFPPI